MVAKIYMDLTISFFVVTMNSRDVYEIIGLRKILHYLVEVFA